MCRTSPPRHNTLSQAAPKRRALTTRVGVWLSETFTARPGDNRSLSRHLQLRKRTGEGMAQSRNTDLSLRFSCFWSFWEAAKPVRLSRLEKGQQGSTVLPSSHVTAISAIAVQSESAVTFVWRSTAARKVTDKKSFKYRKEAFTL